MPNFNRNVEKLLVGCFFISFALYDPQAWHLCDPDAEKVFKAIRKAGVKLAVVSNFDTRLRPLLRALNCDDWFDAVAVSAEVTKVSFSCFTSLFWKSILLPPPLSHVCI